MIGGIYFKPHILNFIEDRQFVAESKYIVETPEIQYEFILYFSTLYTGGPGSSVGIETD
jgi:hypothetical protein